MPREFPRNRRVGEQIRRELAELVRRELKDPRVGMVTFTEVDVSRDLAYAKVYCSALGDAAAIDETLKALNGAAGYLRGELGRRIKIRMVPQLTFHHDTSLERAARLDALIDAAVAADRARDGGDPGDAEER